MLDEELERMDKWPVVPNVTKRDMKPKLWTEITKTPTTKKQVAQPVSKKTGILGLLAMTLKSAAAQQTDYNYSTDMVSNMNGMDPSMYAQQLEDVPADEIKDYLLNLLQQDNAMPRPGKSNGEKRDKRTSKYDLAYEKRLQEDDKKLDRKHREKNTPLESSSEEEDDIESMSAYERSIKDQRRRREKLLKQHKKGKSQPEKTSKPKKRSIPMELMEESEDEPEPPRKRSKKDRQRESKKDHKKDKRPNPYYEEEKKKRMPKPERFMPGEEFEDMDEPSAESQVEEYPMSDSQASASEEVSDSAAEESSSNASGSSSGYYTSDSEVTDSSQQYSSSGEEESASYSESSDGENVLDKHDKKHSKPNEAFDAADEDDGEK